MSASTFAQTLDDAYAYSRKLVSSIRKPEAEPAAAVDEASPLSSEEKAAAAPSPPPERRCWERGVA